MLLLNVLRRIGLACSVMNSVQRIGLWKCSSLDIKKFTCRLPSQWRRQKFESGGHKMPEQSAGWKILMCPSTFLCCLYGFQTRASFSKPGFRVWTRSNTGFGFEFWIFTKGNGKADDRVEEKLTQMKKALRVTQTLRARWLVRFEHRPPVTNTHKQTGPITIHCASS